MKLRTWETGVFGLTVDSTSFVALQRRVPASQNDDLVQFPVPTDLTSGDSFPLKGQQTSCGGALLTSLSLVRSLLSKSFIQAPK